MKVPAQWFCALLDSAAEVYFRYTLVPKRAFVYVSPSIQALTGHAPEEFYASAGLCFGLIAQTDRRLLRRVLRSRRGIMLTLHLVRGDVVVPIELRAVALVRHNKVTAIEGVARLAVAGQPAVTSSTDAPDPEPTQQRLAALMYEVHDLLHCVLPPATRSLTPTARSLKPEARVRVLGELVLDLDRLTATESGTPVALTTREVMVLRYLLERPGRVVTRQHLLNEVWGYRYTGDDRTVDVHISRLRRKLPSLRDRLVALRHIGYRLDEDDEPRAVGH